MTTIIVPNQQLDDHQAVGRHFSVKHTGRTTATVRYPDRAEYDEAQKPSHEPCSIFVTHAEAVEVASTDGESSAWTSRGTLVDVRRVGKHVKCLEDYADDQTRQR